jgi:hemerythrin-like metal-binding protein
MRDVPVWNQSFTVNVKRCDEDHQKLFCLIRRLHDAIEAEQGTVIAREILDELGEYAKKHFSVEEELLEQTKYEGLSHHRVQHHMFVAKLEELEQSLKSAPTSTPIALVEYLKNWLVRHIKMEDQLYSKHLNAKGIQ